jgi:hypothetical protein
LKHINVSHPQNHSLPAKSAAAAAAAAAAEKDLLTDCPIREANCSSTLSATSNPHTFVDDLDTITTKSINASTIKDNR